MQTELQSLGWGERGGFAKTFRQKKRLSALILGCLEFSQNFITCQGLGKGRCPWM